MFPNNMEFFVKERIAERYAEAEQARLGQELDRPGRLGLKPRLGQFIYWLGGQLMEWSDHLRSSDEIPAADQPEQVAP